MKFRAVFLSLLIAAPLLAGEVSPDQQARFLAGLPVTAPELASLTKDGSWQRYAKESTNAWAEIEKRQLGRIREWLPTALGQDSLSKDPLFYMFSGPDFLYANTFFPNASTYVFCGLEPVGAIPDVTKIPSGALSASLSGLRKSLNAVLSFSFFITKDMKNDLRATQLTGTLPILYYFMASLGNEIKTVDLVGIDNDGNFVNDKAVNSGVKITFSRKGGALQTLYYFSTDVSNPGIRSKPGFIKFCDRLGQGNALLKAASYLMHMDEFSYVRDFLLVHAKTLVEDDSGIPFKHFAQDQWDVLCIGHYVGPIDLFKNRYQSDLAAAFKSSKPPALTFSFGYRWHPSESSLIVATSLKSVPKALPVSSR